MQQLPSILDKEYRIKLTKLGLSGLCVFDEIYKLTHGNKRLFTHEEFKPKLNVVELRI